MNYISSKWSMAILIMLVVASPFVNGMLAPTTPPPALVGHVVTESTRYFSGSVIRVRISGTNTANTSLILNSTTSCLFDVAIVEDITSKEVYRYSNVTVCAQVLTSITLTPNQTQTYETSWTHVGDTGLYYVHAWFVGFRTENDAAFWVQEYTVVTQTVVQTVTSATTVDATVTTTMPVYQPPDANFYYLAAVVVILTGVICLMVGYYFRRKPVSSGA